MKRSGLAVAVYLAGAIASYFTVELLRALPGGQVLAAHFIELLAVSIILSAFLEAGLPGKIQWSMLAYHVQGDRKADGPGALALERYALASRAGRLLTTARWIFDLFRRSYADRQSRMIMIVCLLIGIAYFYYRSFGMSLGFISLVILLAVLNSVRKIFCAIMDGQRSFLLSRIVQYLPPISLASHIFFTMPSNAAIDYIFVIGLVYAGYNIISIIIAVAAMMISPHPHLPSVAELMASSEAHSVHWHLIAVSGAIQQQIFFVVSPMMGLHNFSIVFYYSQKIAQMLMEVCNQVMRYIICDPKSSSARRGPSAFFSFSMMLAAGPAAGSLLGFYLANSHIGFADPAVAIFSIDIYISSASTLLGYVGLYYGSAVPFAAHIGNGLLQLALVPLLLHFFGAAGLPMATLASGALTSYRGNYLLYRRSVSRHRLGAGENL